jgi:chromosome segregation ATPase
MPVTNPEAATTALKRALNRIRNERNGIDTQITKLKDRITRVNTEKDGAITAHEAYLRRANMQLDAASREMGDLVALQDGFTAQEQSLQELLNQVNPDDTLGVI